MRTLSKLKKFHDIKPKAFGKQGLPKPKHDRRQRLKDQRLERLRWKEDRFEYALEHLRQAGLGEELDTQFLRNKLRFLRYHKAIDIPRKVPKTFWKKNGCDILALLAQKREERLEEEKQNRMHRRAQAVLNVISEHLRSLPFNTIGPGPGEIACIGKFRQFILDDDKDPLDRVTTEACMSTIAELPEYYLSWQAAKAQLLQRHIGEKDGYTPRPNLELATSVFMCRLCSERVGYPRVLVHHCFHSTMSEASSEGNSHWNGPPGLKVIGDLGYRLWSDEQLLVMDKAPLSKLVQACGGEPDTTTTHALELANPYVECISGPARGMWRWSEAVNNCSVVTYHKPTPPRVRRAEQVERKRFRETISSKDNESVLAIAQCNHCSHIGVSYEHMISV